MANIQVLEGGRIKPEEIDGREVELRKLALQMAVDLPYDQSEAFKVIEHLRTLVGTFLAPRKPA